jgi:hypothetical protein
MTPEEELKRLNRLIHQYETVYRTTPDAGQRGRVERQLRELRSYRDKILAVNEIDPVELDEVVSANQELADFPILQRLVDDNAARRDGLEVASFAPPEEAPTASQREVFHLALYVDFFEREFIPFLSEKQLKLELKYSMDRDGFYAGLQAVVRRLANYREEQERLAQGMVSREMEVEVRKRSFKLKRLIEVEAARFFRAVERFSDELEQDARGDGMKCLNNRSEVFFDRIEGTRMLHGKAVSDALAEMREFSSEAVAFLNIPEIESQEN